MTIRPLPLPAALLLTTLVLLAAALPARAEKADREKPVNLESDKVTVDDAVLKEPARRHGRDVGRRDAVERREARAGQIEVMQRPIGGRWRFRLRRHRQRSQGHNSDQRRESPPHVARAPQGMREDT